MSHFQGGNLLLIVPEIERHLRWHKETLQVAGSTSLKWTKLKTILDEMGKQQWAQWSK